MNTLLKVLVLKKGGNDEKEKSEIGSLAVEIFRFLINGKLNISFFRIKI